MLMKTREYRTAAVTWLELFRKTAEMATAMYLEQYLDSKFPAYS